METSTANLLLLFVLCVSSWLSVNADKTVEVNRCETEIIDTDLLHSWDCDVVDNRIISKMYVGRDCPGSVQSETVIYKDDIIVNTFSQTFKQPFVEFEGMNICGPIEGPDPTDDTCSAAEGEYFAQGCDLSSSMEDMDPGDYTIVVTFKMGDNTIASALIRTKVDGM